MTVSLANPVQDTIIFAVIFFAALVFFLRRTKTSDPLKPAGLLPLSTTQELKGLAILAIVFSHVGYFLVSDHRFLFPLSILAGVGVNLFLFLSGYGLTISSLKKNESILGFYNRRWLRIFIPVWIVLIIFFLTDFYLLHLSYGWEYIARAFAGINLRADLFLDINSPLWYLTPLLFYYLLFPLLFLKKRPWVSALTIYALSYEILLQRPDSIREVAGLYQVHLLAFPLGILIADLFSREELLKKISGYLRSYKKTLVAAYYVSVIALLYLAGYTAYYSGVGKEPRVEELTSLVTMAAIINLFMLKKFRLGLLYIFGLCSYEVYLLHWPLLSRYDFLFTYLPGWLALSLYLVLFIGLAKLLQLLTEFIVGKLNKKKSTAS